MKIAVVIPAYNEQDALAAVLRRIPSTLARHAVMPIVVDDGSKDQTAAQARSIKGVTLLRHRTNLGKGAAAKTGCDAAYKMGAHVIVLMDGDGQHLPEDLGRMIGPLLKSEAPGLVIGTRPMDHRMPLAMKIGNFILSVLARLFFNIRVKDTQSGFRCFGRSVYPLIRWHASNYAMETEMLILAAKHGVRCGEVPIDTIYLDHYKGTTIFDGLRIVKTLLKWRLLWFRVYRSLEPFSV